MYQDTQYYPWGQFWQVDGGWPTGVFGGLYSMQCQFAPCPDQSQNRDYPPTLSRWMVPDPGNAGANPSDPQTWNMYAYARNNPTTDTDPTGEACVQDSSGNWVNDNSGGQTCEEAFSPAQNTPSVTVTGSAPSVATEAVALGGVLVEGAELGPGDLVVAGVLLTAAAVACYQSNCLSNIFSKSNDVTPPSASFPTVSNTASPNPPGGPKYKADKNKLDHVFNPKHNLGSLVQKYGSEEAAYEAISNAADQQLTGSGVANGAQVQLQVGGQTVTVTGFNSPSGYIVGNAWMP